MAKPLYELRDNKGKLITSGVFDHCAVSLRSYCPDGTYRLLGKKTNLEIERSEGILYPIRGYIRNTTVKKRTLPEAKEFFAKP